MARGRLWTREELILNLGVHVQVPLGRMNGTSPEVIELAQLINRSPNTVVVQLGYFTACVPYIIALGCKGMPMGVKRVGRVVWTYRRIVRTLWCSKTARSERSIGKS